MQGLAAFRPPNEVPDCNNMETNLINGKPLLLSDGFGKSMVALFVESISLCKQTAIDKFRNPAKPLQDFNL